MNISNFDDLLRAAHAQVEPQRLLFVFADAVLPDNSTREQRARFEAGQGGALRPLMSVDKEPKELRSFATLADESRAFGRDWTLVFVASLSGHDGRAPTNEQASQALEHMIASIQNGEFGSFIPFDRQGQPVLLG